MGGETEESNRTQKEAGRHGSSFRAPRFSKTIILSRIVNPKSGKGVVAKKTDMTLISRVRQCSIGGESVGEITISFSHGEWKTQATIFK